MTAEFTHGMALPGRETHAKPRCAAPSQLVERYFISDGGTQTGPYSFEQVKSLWLTGVVNRNASVYFELAGQWFDLAVLQPVIEEQPRPRRRPSRIMVALLLCGLLSLVFVEIFPGSAPAMAAAGIVMGTFLPMLLVRRKGTGKAPGNT